MNERPLPYLKCKIIVQGLTLTFFFIQMIILAANVKSRSVENGLLYHDYSEEVNMSQEKRRRFKEIIVDISENSTIADDESLLGEIVYNTEYQENITFFYNDSGEEKSSIATNVKTNKQKRLKDIKRSTSNIFFIESKCGTRKLSEENIKSKNQLELVLSARQCCSVESAATMNPSRDIYILHTCPLNRETPEYAEQLLGLENVWLVQLNVTEFFQGTPVEALHLSGRIEQSLYPVEHSSDIMRLTVLWRYGGTYMDLDVITLRQLDDLKTDFCGLVNDDTIGNAILNFEPQGFGHELLEKTLKHLNNNFNGNLWAVNGPELITRMINEGCHTTGVHVRDCAVFRVYDKSVLYPIYYPDHKLLLTAEVGEEVVKGVMRTAFMIHLWNKYTKEYQVQLSTTQAYSVLARQFCPRVYYSVETFK